ncbi:MAG: hypothetical protein II834_05975 [Bacteroidaceae bacterium]|nr:hypothetical protein [Bacteroidaceae bacterium]
MKKQIIVRALPMFLSSYVLFLCFSCRFCPLFFFVKSEKCILAHSDSANFINNYLQKQYICLNFAEVKLIILVMETENKTVLFYDKRSVLKNIAVGTSVFCNNFKSLFLKGLPYILPLAVLTSLLDMPNVSNFVSILFTIFVGILNILADSLLLAFIAVNLEYYSTYNKVPQYSVKEMFTLVRKKIWKALATTITYILLLAFAICFIDFIALETGMKWIYCFIPLAFILIVIPISLWEIEFNITEYRYGSSFANSFKLGYGNFMSSLVMVILLICAITVPMLLVVSPRMILFLSENMFVQSKAMGDDVSLPAYFGVLQGLSTFVISIVLYLVNIVFFCIYFFFYGSLLNGADKKKAYKNEMAAEEIQ